MSGSKFKPGAIVLIILLSLSISCSSTEYAPPRKLISAKYVAASWSQNHGWDVEMEGGFRYFVRYANPHGVQIGETYWIYKDSRGDFFLSVTRRTR